MTDSVGGSDAYDPDDPVLVELFEEYANRLQAGQPVDLELLAREHPDHANQIRQFLPAMKMLAEIADPGEFIDAAPEASGVLGLGTLGDFRILRELGRGGMGVVYESEQISLGRRVALKVLPFAASIDSRQLQRFKTEAQAAAYLHHPHIVPIHSVGCERGVHYYAMQFIEGQSLAEVVRGLRHMRRMDPQGQLRAFARENGRTELTLLEQLATPRLDSTPGSHTGSGRSESGEPDGHNPAKGASTPRTHSSGRASATDRAFFRTAAHWGIQAAEALHYAHEQGVIHRDVKPANLLLDVRGDIWVTDFGLARLQSDPGLTVTGDLVGTLRYMSPEQAQAKHGVIEYRSDIYSLGATLYELLSLRPAFAGYDREVLLRRIASEEPPSLRRVAPSIPRELETIVAKAMSKEPAERYVTARDLADDLKRFLEDRPILARPPSLSDQFAKWSRRKRGLVISAVALLAVGLVALSVSTFLIWREQQLTRAKEISLRHHLYAAEMNLAQQAWEVGHRSHVLDVLERYLPIPGEDDLRRFEWYYLWQLARPGHRLTLSANTRPLAAVAFSPDGLVLAAADVDGSTTLWETSGGRARVTLRGTGRMILSVEFSPDGRVLATAASSKQNEPGEVKLWDTASGRELVSIRIGDRGTTVYQVKFSPDGNRLCTVGQKSAQLWDAATYKAIGQPLVNKQPMVAASFSPDGRTIAFAGESPDLILWEWESRRERVLSTGQNGGVSSLAFSADGATLATGSQDWTVKLWDVGTGRERAAFSGHSGCILWVAFTPEKRELLTATQGGVIAWNLSAGAVRVLGHLGRSVPVALSPDATTLALGLEDGRLELVDLAPAQPPSVLLEPAVLSPPLALAPYAASLAAFSPHGETLAARGRDGAVRLWDVATGEEKLALPGHSGGASAVAFSPDGRSIATAGIDGDVVIHDWTTGHLRRLPGGHRGPVNILTFSPSGRMLASGGDDQTVRLFDSVGARAPRVLARHRKEITALAFAPNGRTLISAGMDGAVFSWNTAAEHEEPRRITDLNGFTIFAMAYSPDGQTLFTGRGGGSIRLYDVASSRERPGLEGHMFTPRSLAYFADGATLASGSVDGTVKLWDTSTGVARATLKVPEGVVRCVAVSPDGKAICTVTLNGKVRLWRGSGVPATSLRDMGQGTPRSEIPEGIDWNEHDLKLNDQLAWVLVTCPDPSLRNPHSAVALAERVVEHAPLQGSYWRTLGAARYRAGDASSALAALQRARQLQPAVTGLDDALLSLTYARLGRHDLAHDYAERATHWVQSNRPRDPVFHRLVAEAAASAKLSVPAGLVGPASIPPSR